MSSTGQELQEHSRASRAPEVMDEWIEEVTTSTTPVTRAASPAKAPYSLPGDVAAEVRRAFVGTAHAREKAVTTLTRAAEAYDRHRYEEAVRHARDVTELVPGVAAVRELLGLAAYRAERWNLAKANFMVHFEITGNPTHLAKVMDCDRAHRRYRAVEKTFEELEEAQASADELAEGRIVMGATLADQGKFGEAIELLTRAGGAKQLRNPSFRHIRLWYALADVYDRAGDVGAARELFARVVLAEPDAYDAQARLSELGPVSPPKNRRRRSTPVSKKKVVP